MDTLWLDLARLAGVTHRELAERTGFCQAYVREQLRGTRRMMPRLRSVLDELRVGERAVERAQAIAQRSVVTAGRTQGADKATRLLAVLAGALPASPPRVRP